MEKFCSNCGEKIVDGSKFCGKCGKAIGAKNNYSERPSNNSGNVTTGKYRIAAGLFGLLLGPLGIHNFYLGYNGKGTAQLLLTILSCGIFAPVTGVWGMIEGILILTHSVNEDANGNALLD